MVSPHSSMLTRAEVISATSGRSAVTQRKAGMAAPRGSDLTDVSRTGHERFDYGLGQVPVQLQRVPGPVLQRQTQPADSSSQATASHEAHACDQATTHVGDASAIIDQARADAVQFIDAAIPIVMHGLHDAPTTWNGMIARELLDRHFHCPTPENMQYILTTLRTIAAQLPTATLGCLAGEHGRTGEHFSHESDLSAGLLYRDFFHDSPPVRAGTLIMLVGKLLGLPMNYNRHDPSYNEFTRISAGLMTNNPYSYGYFSAAAAGHEVVPDPPGGVTCRPPEPSEPFRSDEVPLSSPPPMACYAQGRETGRQIVLPPPPASGHILTSTTALDGDIFEERVDSGGRRFVCARGRRVDRNWEL